MKKYVEVDREPRVGDMVKIVGAEAVPTTQGELDYKNNDILEIIGTKEHYKDVVYNYGEHGYQYLYRSEFVVVEQVTNEFTKSDIKGGYLVKLRDDEIGLVLMVKNEFNIIGDEGDIMGVSQDYSKELKWLNDDEDELDIIEVYGYTTDQSDLFNPSTRELLFKRVEVEDLGKKEYVIESTVNDNEITIAYNHPNGYDDSDDSIHILIGDDLSDDYAFTTISIQSAKDMISALQEIVDYVEGGK